MKSPIDVAAAIILKDNKVFAARRRQGLHLAGFWEFPGGKVERGETAQDCLVRELKEELEITVRVQFCVGESVYDYGDKIIRLLAYQVEYLSGDFKLSDHDESTWLSIDKLPTLVWAPADAPLISQYQSMVRTSQFYSENAQSYCTETNDIDLHNLYCPFLARLENDAHILDLGCGSGRDSKIFLDRGYTVSAIDASKEMVKIASESTGLPVSVLTFQDLDYDEAFNAIWAMASLLHCPRNTLPDVFRRIVCALKQGGSIFMSFKYGDTDSIDDRDRHFTNFTEKS